MSYLHVDLHARQRSKYAAGPCGDYLEVHRDAGGTVVLLCDGIGSGIHANLSAQFIASRILERIRAGSSLRRAFLDNVQTLEANRGSTMPWGALSIARIRPDGECTLLAYESPAATVLNGRHAIHPQMRPLRGERVLAQEGNCHLRPGDGVLLISDGLSQAGLGRNLPGMVEGWGSEKIRRETDHLLSDGADHKGIAEMLMDKARDLWAGEGDDMSSIVASCRRGITVSIMTGPPENPEADREVVQEFMREKGFHVVCGASTAQLVARVSGRVLDIDKSSLNAIAPPRYQISGFDLVTEGAVTLNQLYNILDSRDEELLDGDPVTDLHALISNADRIRIYEGRAQNPGATGIHYRQQGILHRKYILPLLKEKWQSQGKLVEHFVR